MGNEWFELADPKHFWIQWRFKILQKLIGSHLSPETRILEIGCGNGLVMWQMETILNVIPDGCDLNPQALNEMMPVSGRVFLYDIFDLNPELTGRYDIVMMLDVLEHIDDDLGFLQTAIKHLKPGGWLVAGVPAHQGLYSVYDRLLGHVRRYGKKDLRHLFISAGLVEFEIFFWGMSMLPMLWLRKFFFWLIDENKVIRSGFKPPHPLFNRLMVALMNAETSMFRSAPAGISLMTIGQKPGSDKA